MGKGYAYKVRENKIQIALKFINMFNFTKN